MRGGPNDGKLLKKNSGIIQIKVCENFIAWAATWPRQRSDKARTWKNALGPNRCRNERVVSPHTGIAAHFLYIRANAPVPPSRKRLAGLAVR